jgi:hypothetical protein
MPATYDRKKSGRLNYLLLSYACLYTAGAGLDMESAI